MRWDDLFFDKLNKDLPEEERPPEQFFALWGITDVPNKSYIPIDGYSRSKVANVLFGIGANARWFDKYGIVTLGVHPGVIHTELTRNFAPETIEAVMELFKKGVFKTKSLPAGSSTSLVAALDPKLIGPWETVDGKENHGVFLEDCQITDKCLPLAVSSSHAERLWKQSEEWVKQEFN